MNLSGRTLLLLFALCGLYGQPVKAQQSKACAKDSILLQFEKNMVFALSHDSLKGRLAGTADEVAAGKFIGSQFHALKLDPLNGKSYRHSFKYTDETGIERSAENIIAVAGKRKAPVILVGAHYDHIGMGGKYSRNPGKYEAHNGADDNASGVAVMLGVARWAQSAKKLNCRFVFVAFGAHEPGLFGSAEAVKYLLQQDLPVKAMINLDMVGRLAPDAPALFAGGDSTLVSLLQDRMGANAGMVLHVKELPLGDHSSFAGKNIPVLYLTTGMHDDYHKVTDDAETLNYQGMVKITKVLLNLLQHPDMIVENQKKNP